MDSSTLHFTKFNPHGEVSEEKLLAFIKEKGFENVNIRHSKATEEGTLIHADVQFKDQETAEKALAELRYSSSDLSRELRVTRYRSNIGSTAAFVAKLDNKITSRDLHEALEEIAPEFKVVFVHIPLRNNKDGDIKNKGFAIIMFASDKIVKQFSELAATNPDLHKKLVEKIGEYQFSAYKSDVEMVNHFTRVYVKNLPEGFTAEDGVALAEEKGCRIALTSGVKTISVTSHKFKDGEVACWMVIGFVDHEDAVKFIETVNGSEIKGRKVIACRFATPKALMKQRKMDFQSQKREFSTKYADCNLVVHGLPVGVTNRELSEIFGVFGTIVRSGVPASKTQEYDGRKCPQAFVQFSSVEEANRAVAAVNEHAVGEFEVLAKFVEESGLAPESKISVNIVKSSEERTAAKVSTASRGSWGEAPKQQDDFTRYESANEDERREILGNKLYPRIEEILETEAAFQDTLRRESIAMDEACSMITGMLIALDWTPEKLPMFEELLGSHTNLCAQIESGLKLIIAENKRAEN